jgi:hypothetical protein
MGRRIRAGHRTAAAYLETHGTPPVSLTPVRLLRDQRLRKADERP